MSFLRRSLNSVALGFRRSASRELAFFRAHQWDTPAEIEAIQAERLGALLRHAQREAPYYRELFEKIGFDSTGPVSREELATIPLLPKSVVRARSQELCSSDIDSREAGVNRTSGSTGEPLVLLQGRDDVEISGGTVLRWFYEWHGIRPGDRELKLWGSERDLLTTKTSFFGELHRRLRGIEILNAFRMTPERLGEYIERINTVRPRMIRGYASNLFELTRYAQEQGLEIRPPRLVVSSAGTLYPDMRSRMELVFGCPVFDHYGSRDMHNMAMECPGKSGLHVSAFTHVIEVVDDEGEPCAPGEEGNLVVTALTNYAQPLIRYCIGDRAVLGDERCDCGRGLPKLSRITGRRVDCFRTREGRVVPGEYFIYILGVFLEDTPFARVQAIQNDFDRVEVNLELRAGGELTEATRAEIEEKTKLVMGEACLVDINLVPEIPPLPNGKYPYTICRLPGAADLEP